MKIAVFCGSSSGNDPQFLTATQALGKHLAQNGIDIVYGGGNVGLMGAVADAALSEGGRVYGVIPEHLKQKEIAHEGLTELRVVADMHERKVAMAAMADAFVALPGGAGTLEEIFEAWTWAQLGHHAKPCAFYNVKGFYQPLLEMVRHMADNGFLKPVHASMLVTADTPDTLLAGIAGYQPPEGKWR